MLYQHQKLELSGAQRVSCPVCSGSGRMPEANQLQGLAGHLFNVSRAYPCSCCNGLGVVAMLPNGALFPGFTLAA